MRRRLLGIALLPSFALSVSLAFGQAVTAPSASSADDAYAPKGSTKLPPGDGALDAYADRYRNPDGTITAVISEKPIRARSASGWRDLTGSMSASDAPGFAGVAQGMLTSRLASASTGWSAVSYGGRSVSFAFAQAGGVKAASQAGFASKDGRTMLYVDALPNLNYYLTATTEGGVKEEILLKTRAAAPWNGEFAYALNLDGLDAKAVTDAKGSRILLSESGTGIDSPVMHVEAPFAVDAAGERTDACWYLLADDRKSLTLVVDPNWLSDPKRAYPVTIDPTITSQPGAADGLDAYIDYSNSYVNYGSATALNIGDYGSTSGNDQRAFLRFSLNFLPTAATITQANLAFGHVVNAGGTLRIKISSVLSPWDESTITGNNSPNNYSAIGSYTVNPADSSTWSFDVTGVAQNQFAGTQRNYGFMIQRDNSVNSTGGICASSSDDATAGYQPKLVVTYTAGSESGYYSSTYAGKPRAWQDALQLNPYQVVNLVNGNVTTSLPIAGWQGFGPSVSFSLVHNSREVTGISPNISPKWSFNYAARLELGTGSDPRATVLRHGPDGTLDSYSNPTLIGSGVYGYSSPAGVYDALTYSTSDAAYYLKKPNQVVQKYDATGKLISITDTNNQSVTLAYSSGKLSTITDANPDSSKRRSLTLTYDASGRLSRIADPLQRHWDLTYDANGDLFRVITPQIQYYYGYSYSFVFGYDTDASGNGHNVVSIGEPAQNQSTANPVWNYSTDYDSSGRAVACLGRSGLTTRGMHGYYLTYASSATTVVDQTQVAAISNFTNGTLTSKIQVTNSNDAETSWSGPTTTLDFDASHKLLHVRLPADQTQSPTFWTYALEYSDSVNAPGAVTRSLTNVRNPDGTTAQRETDYAYAHGHYRLTQTKTIFRTTPTVVYHVMNYLYDGDTTNAGTTGWSKLTRVERFDHDDTNGTDTTKRIESYAYYSDATYPGRKQTRTDARGNNWSYEYDAWGNLKKTTSPSPANRTVQCSYESTGNPGMLPVSMTDSAGQTFTNGYGGGNNPSWCLISVTQGGLSKTYSYDFNGQLTGASNFISGGDTIIGVSRTYTDGGLIASESDLTMKTYAYDPMGRREKLSYLISPGGTSTYPAVYTYHGFAGRLTYKYYTGIASDSFSYQYDSQSGALYSESNGNNSVHFIRNNVGEEMSRVIGLTFDTITYAMSRNLDGSLSQIVRTSSTQPGNYTKDLTYDPYGEMTEEKVTPSDYHWNQKHLIYGYDANGNRTSSDSHDDYLSYHYTSTNSYDAGNQLSGLSQIFQSYGQTYNTFSESFATGGFDANGNQLRPTGNGGSSYYTMTYYPDNKLKTTTSNGGYPMTSQYDGLERLFKQGNPSLSVERYVYDGAQKIGVYSNNLFIDERVKGVAVTLDLAYPNGVLNPTKTYLYSDPIGNLSVAQSASTQNVTGVYSPDLYGASDPSSYQQSGCSDYRYDPNSGVVQAGARIYDPNVGRFMQQDPMSFGSGDSTYVYNNPANYHDPTGLMVEINCREASEAFFGFIGATIGAVAGNVLSSYAGVTGMEIGGIVGTVIGTLIATAVTADTGGIGAAAASTIIESFAGLGESIGGAIGFSMSQTTATTMGGLIGTVTGVIAGGDFCDKWGLSQLYEVPGFEEFMDRMSGS